MTSSLAESCPSNGHTTLTPSEVEVLTLIAAGLTGPEIAGRLHRSPGSVAAHARHIREKLSARTLAGAVGIAMSRGLITTIPDDIDMIDGGG